MVDQELKCPNCGPGTKTHKSEKGIVCEQCGGTFTFIAGEAKLKEIGELDKVKADVEELKQRLPASTPAADVEEAQKTEEPEDVEEEEEEDV